MAFSSNESTQLVLSGIAIAFLSLVFFLSPAIAVVSAFSKESLPSLGILIFLNIIITVPIFVFIIQKKIGLEINGILDLGKKAILIFFIAEIPLLFLLYLIPYLISGILGSYGCSGGACDPCSLSDNRPLNDFDYLNPFFNYDCKSLSTSDLACGLVKICMLSRRYLLFYGLQNPFTLFIGGYIAGLMKKKITAKKAV